MPEKCLVCGNASDDVSGRKVFSSEFLKGYGEKSAEGTHLTLPNATLLCTTVLQSGSRNALAGSGLKVGRSPERLRSPGLQVEL